MAVVTRTAIKQAPRVKIGNIEFDSFNELQAMQRIEEFVDSGTPHQVVTGNLRFLTLARKDPEFAGLVNGCGLVVADGMPVIWASKIAGTPISARITGGTLLERCAELAVKYGYSFYLLGAAPGVAEEAATRLQEQFPGLKIAGTQHGYFKPEENADVVSKIREARPEFLFVAMGCPKQEQWIAENLADLQVPACIGIGGMLEIVTGRLKRAPKWMQRFGLEWMYRLMQEPGRLWKRYLLEDIPTGLRIGLGSCGKRIGIGR